MVFIKTDRLKKGMILADDVKDVNGRLLLARGETIGPDHTRIFKIWGITAVNIKGDAEGEDESLFGIDPEVLEETRKKTLTVFSHADLEHPAIEELFKLCTLFRSRHNGKLEKRVITATELDDSINTIKDDILKKLKENRIKLPEMPSIVSELNEVIEDPLASAENIAEVVNMSPSLTALLLTIVNSPLYGFRSRIDKVSRAVTLIGTREISSLALGLIIITIFKNISEDIIDMRSFLKHSLACGLISRSLTAHKNILETEQMFVSGLLHDIGRLIIYTYFSESARILLHRAISSDQILYLEEKSYLGCQHTDIAKYLLNKWKLPAIIKDNVYYHHQPSTAENPTLAAIVHLSDIIANGLGIGTSGENFVPPLDTDAWDGLGLSPSCFELVIQQTTHQVFALENFYNA